MRSRNATSPEFSAAYPSHLVASWPLGVAHSITVRPIRPEDIDLETEFARKLSKETRYNRFLGGGVRLTPEMLEKFTRIDFSRDMALIATATIEGAETAIGVARYARLADDVSCEFAITVADSWQGCGTRSCTARRGSWRCRRISFERSSGARAQRGEGQPSSSTTRRNSGPSGCQSMRNP